MPEVEGSVSAGASGGQRRRGQRLGGPAAAGPVAVVPTAAGLAVARPTAAVCCCNNLGTFVLEEYLQLIKIRVMLKFVKYTFF